MKSQLEEIVRVVAYLEQDLEATRQEVESKRAALEEVREEAERGRTAQVRASEMAAELEKGKIKLLESEKYWLTRCETLLAEERASS